MTFEQFYKALIKRWGIVVICFLFVGLGAYIGSSKFIKPTYQSTVLVEVVIRSGGDPLVNDNILASQQLSETEANLATTYPVLSAVVSRYPGLSVDDLDKEVTATARSNTPLFEINVLDHDPIRAANLANDIAATLIKQQLQLTQPTPTPVVPTPGAPAQNKTTQNKTTQNNFLIIAQSARPASTPARPNKLLNTGGGLLIGLLLGMILAMLLELLDTRIRTKESLMSLLGWSVLCTIWQTAGKGSGAQSINYNANADSYGTLRTNMGFVALDKPLHTLVVTSSTPNEGKSLVATNLAISMAKSGKNTLLIDANLRHPTLYQYFDIPAHAMGFSNAVSDALVLASKADGTLVVVDINRARKGNLKQVKELLEQAGAHVLGCVVNKQHQKRKDIPYKLVPYSTGRWNDRDNYDREDVRRSTVSPVVSVTQVPAATTVPKQSAALSKPEQEKQNDAVDSSEDVSDNEGDQTLTMPRVTQKKAGE